MKRYVCCSCVNEVLETQVTFSPVCPEHAYCGGRVVALDVPDPVRLTAEEIDRLRAIVGKLPTTADGVPIAPPGMNLYDSESDDVLEDVQGFQVENKEFIRIYFGPGLSTSVALTRLFSTRAAAEAARKDGA